MNDLYTPYYGEKKEYWNSTAERLSAFEYYRFLIREQNLTSISKISRITGKPVDQVRHEIQKCLILSIF